VYDSTDGLKVKASDLYSEGFRSETREGHRVPSLRFHMILRMSSDAKAQVVLKLAMIDFSTHFPVQ
jgi:hypothetical protein